MSYPHWTRAGVRKCGNCGRMKNLYRWVTPEGRQSVSCEECATRNGWFIPELSSPAKMHDQSAGQVSTPSESTRPTAWLPADDQDRFSKWVKRGIAIAIGFLIVQIPLALLAMWWFNHQLNKVGF